MPIRTALRRCAASGGCTDSILVSASHAGADGLAGAFGLVPQPAAASAAEAGRGGDLMDEGVPLGAEPVGVLAVPEVVGLVDLLGPGVEAPALLGLGRTTGHTHDDARNRDQTDQPPAGARGAGRRTGGLRHGPR